MILWASKPTFPTVPTPCTAFRKAVELTLTRQGLSFGLYHQYKIEAKWHTSHMPHFEVCVNRPLQWGQQHVYYDGPHCSFSAGYVHFNWSGDNCRKCMPD